MQAVLDGRHARKTRKVRHEFAFSGLLTCGHCGCALVGDIKKGRYVYYRCSHFRGKCPEPYTREEVLEQRFAELVNTIHFSPDVLQWAADAARDGRNDERKAGAEAIARLKRERQRVQDRLDAMYMDKLDGRIDNEFFDRKAAEFRAALARLAGDIAEHEKASGADAAHEVHLHDLSRRAGLLFAVQSASEKRTLLNFVVSECRWKNGELEPVFREPFGMVTQVA